MNTEDIKLVAHFKRLALKWMAVDVDLTKFANDPQYAKGLLTAALNTQQEELRAVAGQVMAVLQGGGTKDPPSGDGGGASGGGGKKYVRGLR